MFKVQKLAGEGDEPFSSFLRRYGSFEEDMPLRAARG